jgi:hypothetical protein
LAEWAKEYGIIERAKFGNVDLSQYSVDLSRRWGSSGVPADLESIARLHPIQAITNAIVRAEKWLQKGDAGWGSNFTETRAQ